MYNLVYKLQYFKYKQSNKKHQLEANVSENSEL